MFLRESTAANPREGKFQFRLRQNKSVLRRGRICQRANDHQAILFIEKKPEQELLPAA
jgi:hypothetical protein